MSFSWNPQDNRKVLAWVGNASQDALLAGDYLLASQILRGAANFFDLFSCHLRCGNQELVDSWLTNITIALHSGICEEYHLGSEFVENRLSVVHCFQLINSFFDLNDFYKGYMTTGGGKLPDLIIPETLEIGEIHSGDSD